MKTAAMIIAGAMPVKEIFGAIDFNVLMMIAGTMGIVSLFIDSKMPALLADLLIKKDAQCKMGDYRSFTFRGTYLIFHTCRFRAAGISFYV